MRISRRHIRLTTFAFVVILLMITIARLFHRGVVSKPAPVKETHRSIKTEDSEKLEKLVSFNRIESYPLSEELTNNDDFFSGIDMKTFTDPFHYINGKTSDYEFNEDTMCRKIELSTTFQVSKQKYLDADFAKYKVALEQNPLYAKIIQDARDKFQPKIPEEQQWFRFAGSSVWLPQYDCHYMVSRIMYSPSGIANKAYASFLYIQLFDKNWNELPETTLSLPYESKQTQKVVNADGSVQEVVLETIIAFRDVTYPSFLPINFEVQLETDNGKYYWGPEDPRILLRRSPLGYDEPVIVYNMKHLDLQKRVMNLYLPFPNVANVLRKRSEKFANIEKNWTPFISRRENQHLNFIYSIVPLEILTCEIDTAVCDFLQKPVKQDYNYVGPLRGGSQLVELPFSDLIPKTVQDRFKFPEGRRVYIGWARAHLNNCGCGESMYRPNMITLIEDYDANQNKYYFKLGDVSEYFDFNAYVPPWTIPSFDSNGQMIESTPKQCEGRNVLIPNSIAYWDIRSIIKGDTLYHRKYFNYIPADEPVVKSAKGVLKHNVADVKKDVKPRILFNDHMGVTLSAADSDVSIVHVRGLLNHILKLPSLLDAGTVISDDYSFEQRGYEFNNKCAMKASADYCSKYGERMAKQVEAVEKAADPDHI
ncbi:predicted protein [Scheffersomyces stipitis CBS 6054]|uniref:Uncharacterized protein n=1 Tax=Scheffersomyces stipitis (strain ATCC 58785 / CBS 6054 / NBRC 10063 / NRRL Y-11545) TaxID=322104 RepID=A3GHD7_PICST|nr:predicted protein [Scheffersomyces stipitis CBS 6054]EAZ62799.2 predicted protein [Scheffersomyces stipitis CBS 6054]